MLCRYAFGQEIPQSNEESALFVEYTWSTNGYNINLKTRQEPYVQKEKTHLQLMIKSW